ncbi:MAG: DUF167 domain-containing protein [Deltaproteobacteria bacterium]
MCKETGDAPSSRIPFLSSLGESGVLVRVHAVPRSGKSGIAGLHGGSLKVKINAPPVDGEANKECRRFLALVFGVPIGNVDLRGGGKCREKVFHVHGISFEDAARRVGHYLPK